uniref:2-polyprenyl-6-methoxyphenol hydroxylase and related FAD-dependent oxidoreductase n=2 Tax=Sphingomonas sp. JE1 TaxID=1628059 RepID=A0A0D5A0B9_9SPHN|nr:2-polyprenyl-6-methoxyphenol hydroxylase and related FAD-dependent oxidoreductase [Sphingomonas sp. JE1]
MTQIFDTPVLIVGGGPVGLGLALDLAWRGNRSMVIERDPATGAVLLAKANGLHERTMETIRRWGLKDEVARVGFPPDLPADSVYCTTMTGHYIGQSVLPSTNTRPTPPESPEKRQRCPQYEFDPMLARAVESRGLTDILYNTEFVSAEQDAEGVSVKVRDVVSGEERSLRTRYLIGCDGAGSRVRRSLGIEFEGRMLDFSLSAMIRIPEIPKDRLVAEGERYLLIDTGGTWGIMTQVDGREIWRYTVVGSQDKLDPAKYDIAQDIRKALGPAEVDFEILRILPWRRSQCVAASYRESRILLAGDSAHTTSPTGGHGMNTGIADAVDLSWMLDALLKGWGGDHLLEAYDLERRPVGVRNSAKAAENYSGWMENSGYEKILLDGPEGDAARADIGARLVAALNGEWNSLGVNLGYRYEGSPIIIPDGSAATLDETTHYIQTARPGHRAPHAWMKDGRSTLDLFGQGFTLLRFDAALDCGALEYAAKAVGMPLCVVDIDDAAIAALYERPLVLVRPDGQSAWRGEAVPADAAAVIDVVRGARTRVAMHDEERAA